MTDASGRRLVAVVAVVACASAGSLLGTACGGSSGEGVANLGTTTTTATGTASSGSSKRDALLAFAACMRKNGLPDFPDPQASRSQMTLSFDPKAPGFKQAERTCRRLLPNGGRPTAQQQAEQLQEALRHAGCMRRHGAPGFPDPKVSADGGIEWGEVGLRVGVDPDSPQFKAAEKACMKLAPGADRESPKP